MSPTLTPEETAAAIEGRPPTCLVPPPSILIEGGQKCGKSWMCAVLTASQMVGDSYWLDLGEGAGDEYGDAITGERTYTVLRHDGSWHEIIKRVREVHAHAAAVHAIGGLPVVLVIDSGSIMWEMLKNWADYRARSSRKNRKRLEEDPNAEITIPPNVWTDVHQRHAEFLKLLITFEGILLITARGRETVKVDKSGNPVQGETDYKVDAQRDIPFATTAHIRVHSDEHTVIIGCRSKHMRIGPKADKPRAVPNFSLEDFIFKGLRFDPTATAARRDYAQPGRERTPEQVRDDALEAHHTHDREALLTLLTEAGHPALLGTTVVSETGDEERLLDLIGRLGRSLDAPPAPAEQPRQGQPPAARQGNRFARARDQRAAQAVPAAPDSAGSSPNEPAPAELLNRLGDALTACGSTGVPAQLAVCAALLGRKLREPQDLTRAEANRIGKAAQAALATAQKSNANPRDVLSAMVGQAMKNRQAAAAAKPGKAA